MLRRTARMTLREAPAAALARAAPASFHAAPPPFRRIAPGRRTAPCYPSPHESVLLRLPQVPGVVFRRDGGGDAVEHLHPPRSRMDLRLRRLRHAHRGCGDRDIARAP